MDHPENLIEIERRLMDESLPPAEQEVLGGIVAEINATLEKKGQVILYGPPGTGKTYYADLAARELAARSWCGRSFGDLSADEQADLFGSGAEQAGAIASCTFHPGYGYEDFIEGFRPVETNGALVFRLEKGVFKRICERAEAKPDKDFFLIIDEINRGDIPRIFGELITLLEKDKRGREVLLPLSHEPFSVPENVHLIGTMNTADRSIALLDTALRRRFGFIELMPDATVLHGSVEGIPLGAWLDALNGRIRTNVGRDGRNLQIGHSYLMAHGRPIADMHEFREALQYEILPLLQEYCYEDFDALERILGTVLVQREGQSFSRDLFRPENELQLVQVLQQLFPEIPASREAVEAAVEDETAATDDDESDDER
jgi:5-methylcytosine-specific restriction protein B